VASRTNAIVVELASSVGADVAVKNYFDLFEYNIDKLISTFRQAGIAPAGQLEKGAQ